MWPFRCAETGFVYARALTAMEALRGRAPGLAVAAGSRGGPLAACGSSGCSVFHTSRHPVVGSMARRGAIVVGVAITLGLGLPWSADRG